MWNVSPTSLPSKVRAFIAIRLDAAVEAAVAGLITRLRTSEDGIRWVKPSNFHLTLFFLGPAVARERLAPVAQALDEIAMATAPFEVEAHGTGTFPNMARPRVIWIELRGPELVSLASRVSEAAERSGFKADRRKYEPHLTIGRVRSLKSWGAVRPILEEETRHSFGISRVDRIVLYRSELAPGASIYHELASFRLGVR